MFLAESKEDFLMFECLICGKIFSSGDELNAHEEAKDLVDSLDSGEIFEGALEEV